MSGMQEYKLIEKHGVCIRVLGDLSLLPPSVRAAAERVMEATQHHQRGRLNICLAYGSVCFRQPEHSFLPLIWHPPADLPICS